MSNSNIAPEHDDITSIEDLEDALDLLIYEERKSAEYVPEGEALMYLKQNGRL